jgi:hypothetical protein
MTVDEFFAGQEESRQLYEALWEMLQALGPVQARATKSQVAFRRRGKAFAWAWMPGKYLRGPAAPLVLTLSLRRRGASPRWKEIAEPYPGHFTHHLELHAASDLDEQVRQWLDEAWDAAG